MNRMVSGSVDIVSTLTQSVEDIVGFSSELVAAYSTFLTETKSRSNIGLNLFSANSIGMSRGILKGLTYADIEDYRKCQVPSFPHIAQLPEQHRTLNIVLRDHLGESFNISIKGAGLSSIYATMGDSPLIPPYLAEFSEMNDLKRPYYIRVTPGKLTPEIVKQFTNIIEDPLGVIGGLPYLRSKNELICTLAQHALMMKVDNRMSISNFPLRIDKIETVFVRQGDERIEVKIEEFLTHKDFLSQNELIRLAHEAKKGARRKEKLLLDRYISMVCRANYKKLYGGSLELVSMAGWIIKRYLGLATILNYSKAGLRVGHAWNALFYPKYRSIPKSNLVHFFPTTKADIDRVLAYIYHYHDMELKLPNDIKDDYAFVHYARDRYEKHGYSYVLHQQSNDIYSYLYRVGQININSASRIYERFLNSFYREIGVLHGAGGHFGGDSLDLAFNAKYINTSSGGSGISPRDVDIRGGLHDLASFTYMPFLGIDVHKKKKSSFDKTKRELQEHEHHLERLQASDLNLAARTSLLMAEMLFGKPMRRRDSNYFNLWGEPATEEIFKNGCWGNEKIKALYYTYREKALNLQLNQTFYP